MKLFAGNPASLGGAGIIYAVLMLITACSQEPTEFEVLRIAHAGGGIDGETYTNSYEAMDHNVLKGYRYFEIDFTFTSDGKLVCLHDWRHSFKKWFGFQTSEKASLETFEFLARNASKYRMCTLNGLASWMLDHPSVVLVTDVKEDNVKALSIIRNKIADASARVIPQVYQPENFRAIKRMGFQAMIWTLYRYTGSTEEILQWVDRFEQPFAVTMPKAKAIHGLGLELEKKNIPTYVHTVNDDSEAVTLANEYGINEIYTDFLAPTAH